jgi:CBS domain-containing protein
MGQLVKVRDVMSKNIVMVESSASLLDAVRTMNKTGVTGAVIMQDKKVVGVISERALLRRFIPLNKKPEQTRVTEAMAPLLRIDANATTREAANKILSNRVTRLGVFDGDNIVGWMTVTDLAREHVRMSRLDMLVRRRDDEVDEILCPKCRNGPLEKIVTKDGRILRWECPRCGHVE